MQDESQTITGSSTHLGSSFTTVLNGAFESFWETTNIASIQQSQYIPSADLVSSMRYGSSMTVQSQLERVKRKKVAKLKKNVTEAEIGKAIAKHTKEKAKEVLNQTKTLEASIDQEEKMVAEKTRMLQKTKSRLGYYTTQKNRLKKTTKQLAKEFEEIVTALKQDERIANVTLDTSGRLVVTTTPLTVQQTDKKEPDPIGVYQIRIDFAKKNIREGVRVLNITKRYQDVYDSPTISGTYCCWGNVQKDIARDFYTQNIQELVLDMLEYITSPNVQSGYLGNGEKENSGWEVFLTEPNVMPDGYSWEAFEKDHGETSEEESDRIDHLESLDFGREHTGTLGVLASPNFREERDFLRSQLSREQERLNRSEIRLAEAGVAPRNQYETELARVLQAMGVIERAVPHYLQMMRDVIRRPGERPVVYFTIRLRNAVYAEVSSEDQRELQFQILTQDMSREAITELQMRPEMRYQINTRRLMYSDPASMNPFVPESMTARIGSLGEPIHTPNQGLHDLRAAVESQQVAAQVALENASSSLTQQEQAAPSTNSTLTLGNISTMYEDLLRSTNRS